MASTPEQRKQNEIAQGRAIVARAEEVWQRDTLAGKLRMEQRFEDLQKSFSPIFKSSRVLELGSGTGTWTEFLVKAFEDVTSVDISEDLLKAARKKLQGKNVKFVRGDVEALPFPPNSFDFVCGLSVLHHLDLPGVLKEAYRVLKPVGRIWFSEPNMLNPQIMVQKNVPIIKRWAADTPDETAFFRWPLERALRIAGFVNVSVRPFDFLHPQTPEPLIPIVSRIGSWMEKTPVFREIAGSLLVHAQK